MGDEKSNHHIMEHHDDLKADSHQVAAKDGDEATNTATGYFCQSKFPWFGDIRIYTAVFSSLTFAYGMYWGYIAAVLTFIERRYQMSSSMSGFMLTCPEIGRLCLLLFTSHFGNRFNKSRVLSVTFILVSIAVFCQTLPHYIIRPEDSATDTVIGNDTVSSTDILCSIKSLATDEVSDREIEKMPAVAFNTNAAYAIFVTFFMLMGASATSYFSMGFAYIENNSQPSQAGRLLGMANTGLAFGLMAGMFLAAWCASIYVDLEDTQLTPDDPSWVGAWWLGLVIISICQLLMAILLSCFPRNIPVKPDTNADLECQVTRLPLRNDPAATRSNVLLPKNKEKHINVRRAIRDESPISDEMKVTYNFKGLSKALFYLVTNPVYIFLVLGFAASNMYVGGFWIFLPKYTETQFSIPVQRAILIVAIVNGIGMAVASLFGGHIISCLKLTTKGLLQMVLILTTVAIVCSAATIFLGCDNATIDGVSDINSALTMQKPCSSGCHCDLAVYSPVCDDGVTYFSPCHAGCLTHNITEDDQNKMFLSCNCTESGTATHGACANDCVMLIPFIILVIGAFLAYGATVIAINLLVFRVVPKCYTSLSIGVSTMANSSIGWMSGASIYGAVIDTTCLVWQKTSSGEPGFCWIYDLPAFRYKIMGLNTGCFVILLVFAFISFMFHRRKMSMVI